MSKYISDTAAGKSISAYVILNPKGKHVATVRAHFSNSGVCLVNVHDFNGEFQHAKAGGYGYDKFSSALSGMTVDGHTMSDHSSTSGAPKPPKGRKTFPRDYKPRKGYSLANWASVSRATGRTMHSYAFRDMAEKELGLNDTSGATPRSSWTDEQWAQVSDLADKLEREWRESDDCETGYTSCHRESGLKYLEAIGYRVIQAI